MTSPSIRPEKIEELIAELRDGYRINMGGETIAHSPPTRRDLKAAKLIESLKAENNGLRKLLEPFARVADMTKLEFTGSSVSVNVDRCRAARAFLTAQEAKP